MKTKGVVKQVIYMYGGPGLGKTRLAKSYAEKKKNLIISLALVATLFKATVTKKRHY